jgi:hypothetical protein
MTTPPRARAATERGRHPEQPDAVIRVYVARTVRWRGIFAVHSWIARLT